MIPFFKTQYFIARPPEAVYEFMADFRNYFDQLPEFAGARLSTDDSPVGPEKLFVVRTEKQSYEYQTQVRMLRMEPPRLIEYEYAYLHKDSGSVEESASPMPWRKAQVTMQIQPYEQGTQVVTEMHVFGVKGFFARWKVTALKAACARAQKNANDNMVQVAERNIPESASGAGPGGGTDSDRQ